MGGIQFISGSYDCPGLRESRPRYVPVAQDMLVREVPVRIHECGLQDVTVTSVLLCYVILQLFLFDFTEHYKLSK